MTNIKDLLKQYADACEAISRLSARMFGAHGLEINSLEKRRADLESQIIKLFEEARSEGARVEREAIKQIAKKELLGLDCAHERVVTRIVRAIEERGNQADEGKVGEHAHKET